MNSGDALKHLYRARTRTPLLRSVRARHLPIGDRATYKVARITHPRRKPGGIDAGVLIQAITIATIARPTTERPGDFAWLRFIVVPQELLPRSGSPDAYIQRAIPCDAIAYRAHPTCTTLLYLDAMIQVGIRRVRAVPGITHVAGLSAPPFRPRCFRR